MPDFDEKLSAASPAPASTRSSLARICQAVIVAAILAACDSGTVPEWHHADGYRWRDLNVRRGGAGFTSLAAGKTGVTFANAVSDALLVGNRVLGQGAGVALGDVDGDGRADLFLARTEGCSALFRNLGNWTFEEVTAAAGVGACDRHSSAAAFADVDGDGDLDLVLLATTGPNAIFLNDGSGRFAERRDLGLDPQGRGGATLTMADVDGSGRLAMYVANYKPYFVDDSVPPERRTHSQLVREVSPGRFEIAPEHRANYRLVNRADMGGMRTTQRAERDHFYLREGDGRFRRVSPAEARFRDAAGRPVAEEDESFALGARFADLNGDGAPDLFVANDFEDLDRLWFNDGTGRFRLADWTSLRQMSNSTMGVDVADVNGDGLPDVFAVDMLASDSRRLRMQVPTNTAFPKKPGRPELQLQHQRNTLFLNRGDGTFAEVAQYAGVAASGWSWGTMFLDVDLDGNQDILVANGHLWDIMDADVQDRLQNRMTAVDWQRMRWEFPKLELGNIAFRNRGDLTFENASAKWGFDVGPDISHGIASADLDGDGDQDVVVNRLGKPALLLRNNGGASRVAVRLRGTGANSQAVGATIRLLDGAVPVQSREVTVGGLYMSHSDYLATFAMGRSASATIVVDWRDGRRTTITGVKPNRLYEITDSTAGERPKAPPADSALFVDASAELRGHAHTENDFDDWGRQYLLPSGLSPMGPGVTWFDADRDGAEDLVVGAGKDGRIALFRSIGGRLVPQAQSFPQAPAALTTVLGMADDRGARILAGVYTWQARSDQELNATPSVIEVALRGGAPAGRAETAIPPHASSTGPVALADYDGDGDLDMFVGSRAIPMQYPLPPSSALFRNVDGKFLFDEGNENVLRSVGMVSAAMFADINGDGHQDIVLAREWDSLLLLLNNGQGNFSPAPATWGLGRWTSRWNGLAAGDVDGDGRLDLVATSWGRNTPYQADSTNPLVMVHGPIGAVREQEMLIARHDSRVGGLAAMTDFVRVRLAIPDITNNVRTFGEWADATVERALGAQAARTSRMTAVTMDHMVFLNRGDRFEAVPLPTEAQLAPAFYAGVADFDGDGSDDVFVAQNFSGTLVGHPRDDAGRGLLLLNDGAGGLTPVSGARSGIRIYGDQRGAAYADYDRDGRVDLAVSQNAGATRLFRNRGARPGLRVRVQGGVANPDAVGAQVRVIYGDRMGPVREIQSGAGYWSQNGAVQVFGLSGTPTGVWVRWPGGAVSRVNVPAGAREVVVAPPAR